MPRSYWRIVFAVVGFLVLTGEHPNPSAQAEQAHAQQSVANSSSNIAAANHDLAKGSERPPKRDPCGPHYYHSNADLCAQWEAADAAVNAARWTVIGAIVSAASFIGVLIALGLAFHSNWIARDTAKRQLRAYISVTRVEIFSHVTKPDKIIIAAHFRNDGETPARKARACLRCQIVPGVHVSCKPVHADSSSNESVLNMGKGSEWLVSDFIGAPQGKSGRDITYGEYTTFAYGHIIYEDIFGESHKTTYCSYINPETRDKATTKDGSPNVVAAAEGNDAD